MYEQQNSHQQQQSSVAGSCDDMLRGGNRYVQMLGAIIIVAGFVEMIIGAMVMSTVTTIFGAWWAGIGCMVCAIFALVQNNEQLRKCSFCFALLAALCALGGLIMDGAGYNYMKTFDTCISSSGEAFGDTSPSAVTFVMLCGGRDEYDCVCGDTSLDVSDDKACIGLDLNHDSGNCGQILGIYTTMLFKSTQCLDVLVALTLFLLAYLTTMRCCPGTFSACCPTGCCDIRDETQQLQYTQQQRQPLLGGVEEGMSGGTISVHSVVAATGTGGDYNNGADGGNSSSINTGSYQPAPSAYAPDKAP